MGTLVGSVNVPYRNVIFDLGSDRMFSTGICAIIETFFPILKMGGLLQLVILCTFT